MTHVVGKPAPSSQRLNQLGQYASSPGHTGCFYAAITLPDAYVKACQFYENIQLPHITAFLHILAKCTYHIFFPHKLTFSMAILIFFVFLLESIFLAIR